MKKCALPAAWPVILAGLLFIFGCNKSGRLPGLQDVDELCPIKRFSFFNGDLRDTITFSYDWLGRPVNSTATFLDDGSSRYVFRYDERGRLQDFIGPLKPGPSYYGPADFWTRYTYSEDNRTIWDTTYTLATVSATWPPGPEYADLITQVKTYDREGRVIQIITSIPPFYIGDSLIREIIRNITYDARGDAQNPQVPIQDGQAYDDEINYHRTNKVWMQIDDQYSVHNPLVTGGYIYNRYGLPVRFGSTAFLGTEEASAVVMEYECELPKGLAPGE